MKPVRLRHVLFALLILAAALPAAGIFFREALLNDWLRPQLERSVGKRLVAEVRLGRIDLAAGRLTLTDLFLQRPGRYRVVLPAVVADFSFDGLRQRRLDRLQLLSPQVALESGLAEALPRAAPPSDREDPAPSGRGRRPFSVTRIDVSDGHLSYAAAGRSYQARTLQASLTGEGQGYRFAVHTLLGPKSDLALAVEGLGSWGDRALLRLDAVRWQGRELLAAPLGVSIPAGQPVAFGGSLVVEQFDTGQLATLLSALEIASPLPADWHFAGERVEISLWRAGDDLGIALRLPQVTVTGPAATFPLQEVTAALRRRPGRWQGEGRFVLAGSDGQFQVGIEGGDIEGELELEVPDPAALGSALIGRAPLPLRGGVSLRTEFARSGENLTAHGTWRGHSAPKRFGQGFDLTPLAGDFTWEGRGEKQTVTALVRQQGGELLKVRGDGQTWQAELLPRSWQELQGLLDPRQRPAPILGGEGLAGSLGITRNQQGQWLVAGNLRAETLVLTGAELHQLSLTGELLPRDKGWEVRNFEVAARARRGGTVTATVRAHGNLNLTGQRYRLGIDSLTVAELDYLAADGLSGLSGGHLQARGNLAGTLDDTPVALHLRAAFGAGEILKGAFYADLSALAGELDLKGYFAPGSRQLWLEAGAGQIGDLGSVRLHGEFFPDRVEAEGVLTLPDLSTELFDALKAAFVASTPALEGLTQRGGCELAGRVAWRPGRWQAQGDLQPQHLTLAWERAGVEAIDVNGSLPFVFAVAPDGQQSAFLPEELPGHLTFARLRAGPATLAGNRVSLLAARHRLALAAPLTFELAGGRLEIPQFRLAMAGNQPDLTAQLRVAEVDLEQLSGALHLPPMTGSLSADLGAIRYADGMVHSEGTAVIEAFGGRVEARNLRIEDPFGRYPVVAGDINLAAIDLNRLTHTLAFGEMNGVLDGTISNLRLLGKTPVAFAAQLQTRPQGKRNISVKALNNLSILSQGGLSAALSRGLYRFIDFYRYQQLGLNCTLHNDRFRLQGTARPGSDQYLVYGGWRLPRIDIVIASPTISFKEMLRRLNRIDRTGR